MLIHDRQCLTLQFHYGVFSITHTAEAGVRLRALKLVAEALEDGSYDAFMPFGIAPGADAKGDDSIDLLFNLVNKLDDFFDAIGGHFDFDNGGENLFPEYILAKSASRDIAHKQGERIFLFERHVRCS